MKLEECLKNRADFRCRDGRKLISSAGAMLTVPVHSAGLMLAVSYIPEYSSCGFPRTGLPMMATYFMDGPGCSPQAWTEWHRYHMFYSNFSILMVLSWHHPYCTAPLRRHTFCLGCTGIENDRLSFFDFASDLRFLLTVEICFPDPINLTGTICTVHAHLHLYLPGINVTCDQCRSSSS